METLKKILTGKAHTTSNESENLIETLSQRKSINEDLQNLGLRLFHIENSIKKAGLEKTLEKHKTDDDSYRCFAKIFDFINSYELNDLENLANYYKELKIESESKLVHFNEIKRAQINFLKNTFEFLVGDFKNLKEKIRDDSLIFIKKSAFSKPECFSITNEQKQNMRMFLNEFPSRLNYIEEFLNKIYALGSKKTKDKLEELKKMKEYL